MTDSHLLSLVLDGAVIALLAAVIVFSSRLSLHLRDFRAGRRDMERLVRDLSANVERADMAMAGLREAAKESGRDLQSLINEAKALADELQMMSEAGNNMARRLETVAEKSARGKTAGASPRSRVADAAFTIRDPEFGLPGGEEDDDDDRGIFDDGAESGLQSRAERELFEALQGAPRKKARV